MPRFSSRALAALLAIGLWGCAGFQSAPVHLGDTEAQVLAARGKPTNRYQLADGYLLEYAHGPYGQETYMARFGPDGRLISLEQVLTSAKFTSIKIDQSTKEDVLHTIGSSQDHSYLTLPQLEVWSYPYKENGIWDSIMHVHFDRAGIVRKMVNTPDPRSPIRGGAPGGGPSMGW